ncbi:50S ribosomal protein L1 [bacterium]|nr:50S ribosomal protein L1 [bacterium]MBU1025667.1 50S ribosomal protein L1 [bacterium]
MVKHGKKYLEAASKIDADKIYNWEDAIGLIGQTNASKFDATIDLAICTGLDTRHADQQIRGSTPLPKGIGKTVTIACFVMGEKEIEAREAGADIIGGDDLAEKIQKGFSDFDVVLATPEMMKVVGKLGRVLGPRGLMPNPKTGTVTNNIGDAVQEYKSGKVNYRADAGGVIHAIIGKSSFSVDDLKENFLTFYKAVLKAKPSGCKGVYLKKLFLSTSQGPSFKVDLKTIPG